MKGLIAGLLEFQIEKEIKLGVTHETYNKEKRILSIYYAEEKVVAGTAEAIAKLASEQEVNEMLDPGDAFNEPLELITKAEVTSEVLTERKAASNQKDPTPDLGNLDVVRKILSASRNGALKVNLMHATKITLSEAKEYVQNLVKAGLLEIKKEGETETITYHTTTKGQDYLDAHERLSSMLQQDFPDTRIIRKAQGE